MRDNIQDIETSLSLPERGTGQGKPHRFQNLEL